MSSTADLFEASVAKRRGDSSVPEQPLGDRFWGTFWGALTIASIPLLMVYLGQMWSLERYQYFPFVFVAFGVLLYKRFDRHFTRPKDWYRWAQIGVGMLCVVAATYLRSPWLNAIGFVLVMASFLGSSRDTQGRSLIPLVLPLLMLIRLPLGYDQLLVIKLQSITTDLSSVMLDLFGVPHVAAANVIGLTNKELFVAEACSGIQSVFTLAFIALVVITFLERRIWLTPIYLIISVLLAVAANVIRVTTVALGEAWYSVDLASGWTHDLIGYLALVSAVLFLLSFDQLVMVFLHPVEVPAVPVRNPLAVAWNWLVDNPTPKTNKDRSSVPEPGLFRYLRMGWVRVAFVVLVAAIVTGSAAQATRIAFVDPPDAEAGPGGMLVEVSPDLISTEQFASVEVTEHEISRGGSNPRLGDNADLWTVKLGDDLEGQMVLSQPYSGWHELCMCYEIRDWILINREVISPQPEEEIDLQKDTEKSVDPESTPFAVARLKSSAAGYGYLIYTCIGANGDLIAPPPSPGRLGSRFDDFLYSGDAYDRNDLMMLQLWFVSPTKVAPGRINDISREFLKARQTVMEAVTSRGGSGSEGTGANTQSQASRTPTDNPSTGTKSDPSASSGGKP